MVSLEVLGYLGIHLKNIRRRTNGGKKAMWKRRKGQKKKLKIGKKTHTKTPQNKTEINPIISLIIISTDKLNVLIKWQSVRMDFKNSTIFCLQVIHTKYKDISIERL